MHVKMFLSMGVFVIVDFTVTVMVDMLVRFIAYGPSNPPNCVDKPEGDEGPDGDVATNRLE